MINHTHKRSEFNDFCILCFEPMDIQEELPCSVACICHCPIDNARQDDIASSSHASKCVHCMKPTHTHGSLAGCKACEESVKPITKECAICGVHTGKKIDIEKSVKLAKEIKASEQECTCHCHRSIHKITADGTDRDMCREQSCEHCVPVVSSDVTPVSSLMSTVQGESWEERFSRFIKDSCEDGGEEKFISNGYAFYDDLKDFIREALKADRIHLIQEVEKLPKYHLLNDDIPVWAYSADSIEEILKK